MRSQFNLRRSTAALAAALAALALTAPVAAARPVEQFLGTESTQSPCAISREALTSPACEEQALASRGTGRPTADVPAASVARDVSTDTGFSWGAAAIGAGTAVALLALGRWRPSRSPGAVASAPRADGRAAAK
jgi:hypothetical protein